MKEKIIIYIRQAYFSITRDILPFVINIFIESIEKFGTQKKEA